MGHYVYKYVLNDEIIYVGKCDGNLDSRLSQHGCKGDNIDAAAWNDIRASTVFYTELANSTMSDVVESELIRRYKPKYNRAKMSDWDGLTFPEPEWKKYKKVKPTKAKTKIVDDSLLTQAQYENKYRFSKHCSKAGATKFNCPKTLFVKKDADLSSFLSSANNLAEILKIINRLNYTNDGHIAKHTIVSIGGDTNNLVSVLMHIKLQYGDESFAETIMPLLKAQAYAESLLINAATLVGDVFSEEDVSAFNGAKSLCKFASSYAFISEDEFDDYMSLYDEYRDKLYANGTPHIQQGFGFNGKAAYVLTRFPSPECNFLREIVTEKIEPWMLNENLWDAHIHKPSENNFWIYKTYPLSDIQVSVGGIHMSFT